MRFQFHIIASSSSGNCSLLVTPTAKILVDAGISAKRIRDAVERLGYSLDEIEAVFITHEHSDHCAAVPVLAKLPHLVFYATEGTAAAVERSAPCVKAGVKPRWRLFEAGVPFKHNALSVAAFSIPHDAADPVGYVFSEETAPEKTETLAWVTDLGYVTPLVRERIKHVDYLVLESNYDRHLLDISQRPLSLKQRIRGRHGHLDNEDALELLVTLENPRLRHVFLAHLSNECNSPAKVNEALASVRLFRPDCRFTVVEPQSPEIFSL